MIVECQGCNTIFPVDPNKVPTAGIHARCSVCSEVFFVSVPEAEPEPVQPDSADHPEEATFPEASLDEEPSEEEPQDGVEEETEGDPESWTKVALEEEGEALTETAETLGGVEESLEEAVDVVMEEIPEGPPGPGPLFGKRDPTDKAKRLARVLVSDIILYNPDRHHDATESGRVKEEFEEEIQKSWDEYVEQVGDEIANSTDFFTDALNEILAKGEKIF